MKPNDENGKLSTAERPFRVLIISGSDRLLVCVNGGNPREDLIGHKEAELAKQFEHSKA